MYDFVNDFADIAMVLSDVKDLVKFLKVNFTALKYPGPWSSSCMLGSWTYHMSAIAYDMMYIICLLISRNCRGSVAMIYT